MNRKIIEFAKGIYREHLEEASFLYAYRLILLGNPEIPWPHIDVREEQLEAQIDALAVDDGIALDVCLERANEGDAGELYSAVCVMCRMDRKELIVELLNSIDPEDKERVQAITDALKWELPEAWETGFPDMLLEDRKNIPIIAEVAGYRRLSAGRELQRILRREDLDSPAAVIRALGRLQEKDVQPLPAIGNYLGHDDEKVCYETALALLRIGSAKTLGDCLKYAGSRNWPFIALGLGGDRSTVSSLLGLMTSDDVSADYLFALGLLGDISAVDRLIACLDSKHAGYSATALDLITGAAIYEETFVPEEIDEDELLDEELEKLKRGEPLYPPGEEPGETVIRLSQNPQDWINWWAANKSRFDPKVRYRNGKPYSPSCLMENLLNDKSRFQVRQMACEELAIRYGADFPFEADMFIARQKLVLKEMERWAASNADRFKQGAWYFAGRLISG